SAAERRDTLSGASAEPPGKSAWSQFSAAGRRSSCLSWGPPGGAVAPGRAGPIPGGLPVHIAVREGHCGYTGHGPGVAAVAGRAAMASAPSPLRELAEVAGAAQAFQLESEFDLGGTLSLRFQVSRLQVNGQWVCHYHFLQKKGDHAQATGGGPIPGP